MVWVACIQLILKLLSSAVGYLSNRQLLEAGQAVAIKEGLQLTLANMEKANAVKKELADNPDGDYARKLREKYERADNE